MTKSKLIRKGVMDLLEGMVKANYGEQNIRRSNDNELLIKFPQPDGGPIYVEVNLKLPI